MTPAEGRLVSYAIDRLAVVSGQLLLTPTSRVGEFSYLGSFNEETRHLEVATGTPGWSGVLAHELGHVEQMIAKKFVHGGTAIETFDSHLAGKSVPARKLLRATRLIQRMELDAERYATFLIKDFKLPVDLDDYIRSANSYILSWEWARRHGRWHKSSASGLCRNRLITERQFGQLTQEQESAFAAEPVEHPIS